MDFAKVVVIVIVVALGLALLAVAVAGHGWVQPAHEAMTFLAEPMESVVHTADTSTAPWAVAVGVVRLGLGGVESGPYRGGGVTFLKSIARFLLAMLVVWFIFRIGLRVLKG